MYIKAQMHVHFIRVTCIHWKEEISPSTASLFLRSKFSVFCLTSWFSIRWLSSHELIQSAIFLLIHWILIYDHRELSITSHRQELFSLLKAFRPFALYSLQERKFTQFELPWIFPTHTRVNWCSQMPKICFASSEISFHSLSLASWGS